MRFQAMLLAGALFVTAPAAAFAQGYQDPYGYTQQGYGQTYGQQGYGQPVDPECQRLRQNRTTWGAAIGALAGGLLGTSVADEDDETEGAALGAIVGAVAGGAAGRYTAQCPPPGAQTGYGQPGYGGAPVYGYGQQAPAPAYPDY